MSATPYSTIAAALGAALLMSAPSVAGEQFVDKEGVANFGYDIVAYHTTFTPTLGSDVHTAEYNGAVFHFASETNRDLFAADPDRYAPAYDGHCAFAPASHKKLVVDPEAFSIVNPATGALVDQASYDPAVSAGVLYLNYSPGVNRQFNDDIPGNIQKADFAWDDCLEHRPAARPRKGVRDLLPGRRPGECPAG